MSNDATLHIGEPNDIALPITDRRTGVSIDDASPVFTIKTTSGTTVGTADQAMTYDVTKQEYFGVFPADEASSLIENGEYYVWITAEDITLRRILCVATYRGLD